MEPRLIKKLNKGFTLVETLVSIALFGIISLILINVFIVSIKTQTRILQGQELVEQSSYALEYMGSKMRMAIKDETGSCIGLSNVGKSYGLDTNSIIFLSPDSANIDNYLCRQFFLDSNSIKERVSVDTSVPGGSGNIITSPSFNADNLTFYVKGDESNLQPRVTISIVMHKEDKGDNISKMIVQTTISKRQIDI